MWSNCNGYYDSTTHYKDYIKLAKENGMKSIAFSNHGGIYEWVMRKLECDKNDIKYIHGVELYLCDKLEDNVKGYHIGLYAKNWDGVKELNKLNSLSTSKGSSEDKTDRHFYYNPRISIDELMSTSDNIIITTACLSSVLWRPQFSKKVENLSKEEYEYENNKWKSLRERFLKWMSKNSHRCFLEVQYHISEDQSKFNKQLYKWSKEYNIPLIAGTDTHSSTDYKSKCRLILQASQSNSTKTDKSMDVGYEDEFDLTWKSYEELVDYFAEQDSLPEDVYLEAIENTNKFSDMVENFDLSRDFKYPDLYVDVKGKWKKTIMKKFNYKLKNGIIDKDKKEQYKERIKEEFIAMCEQGMESFMLFMSEMIDFCEENDIPHGDRGSVSGSMIAYITDITDTDPIVWDTVFSRFLNKDRVNLADIDVDHAPEDRVKVYEYITQRFGGRGSKKTSFIAQFGTLKDRGTIDALARGLNYTDLKQVESIKNDFDEIFMKYSSIIQEEINLEEFDPPEARSIDFDYHDLYMFQIRNESAKDKLDKYKLRFDELKSNNEDLFYYFEGLKGTIMSKGNHPAGMIGSPISLHDNLGVYYKDGDEDAPVSQCAMKAVDYLNFVKFDILGLKTMGIIKDTYKYAGERMLKSHEIDWNDKKVWDEMKLSRVGVFQFEKENSFNMLKKFECSRINDMSLISAAVRPSGKSYRDRLVAGEWNKNPSKQIDDLLSKNYGWLTYQEDTNKFLMEICGLSGSKADTIRRYIGKKETDKLHAEIPNILDGYCKTSDKPREIAEEEAKQFLQIIDDSSEYQFGYNHATGYSKNGYVATRLRAYYPLEFTTAYLNRADDKEHIQMGHELAKVKGITINPIKFQHSRAEYTFDRKNNSIYKGIGSIKYMNSKIADDMYDLKGNKYKHFYNVLEDITLKTSVNARQLKILIQMDFFSEYGKNRKLLEFAKHFDDIFGKKQFAKKKVDKLGLSHECFQEGSRDTGKTYMEIDSEKILKRIWDSIENKALPLKEQIKVEMENLNYINFVEPKIDKDYYAVIDYKTFEDKNKPYVTLYQVKTGLSFRAKVTSGTKFLSNKFELYDVIKVDKFNINEKNKVTHTISLWQKF